MRLLQVWDAATPLGALDPHSQREPQPALPVQIVVIYQPRRPQWIA